jgi:hypothetical protein
VILIDCWEVMMMYDESVVRFGDPNFREWRRRPGIGAISCLVDYTGEACRDVILSWVKNDEKGSLDSVMRLGALESVAAHCEGNDLCSIVEVINLELGSWCEHKRRAVVKAAAYCIQAVLNSRELWSDSVDSKVLAGLAQACGMIEGILNGYGEDKKSESLLAVTGGAFEGVLGLLTYHGN